MRVFRIALPTLAGLSLVISSQIVSAQHHHGGGHFNHSGHGGMIHHQGHYNGGTIHHNGHYDGGTIYHNGHYNGGTIHHDGHYYGGTVHHDGHYYGGTVHHGGYISHSSHAHVIPSVGHQHHGTYYIDGGNHYYYPQTASVEPTVHTVARPVQIEFGGFAQVEDLSGRLEVLVNDLCLDLHHNYSHNYGYAETYREAYQLLEVAKYIHGAEHANDREAIRSKLGGMDALFHHIQGDVRGWSRQHHVQVGQLGIITKMDMIESTLHHLMNDVGVQSADAPGATAVLAPPPAELIPAPAGLTPAPLTASPPLQ